LRHAVTYRAMKPPISFFLYERICTYLGTIFSRGKGPSRAPDISGEMVVPTRSDFSRIAVINLILRNCSFSSS